MVELITRLRAQIDTGLPARAHPMAGPPFMTIGVIHGGIVVNMVPDSCTIEIDRRMLPGEDPDAILAEIDALVAQLIERTPTSTSCAKSRS